MSKHTATLTFHGGVGEVTGANFLLETASPKLLVDCGLVQGAESAKRANRAPFPYPPHGIDALLVTHAHIDHIGRIPRLVREGFRGTIYSTEATRELAAVMFEDSVGILAEEAEERGEEALYGREDAAQALLQWQTLRYHEPCELGDGTAFHFRDAGHILGSASVWIERAGRALVFTGDLGNTPAPLLPETEPVAGAHYLVMESVYGDREHEDVEARRRILAASLRRAAARGGALVIPAFSLERTQSLLYELNNLIEEGAVPRMPVFLDSPLAIKLTDIYRRYTERFKEEVRADAKQDAIFDFPGLTMTESVAESKAIADAPNPKVIIAGSGMSDAGRVRHHEKRYLPDADSTVLLVGYQALGTLGRKLEDGAREVEIHGARVPVRARVERIRGYSAHKDVNGLVDFVADAAETLERVFVTMGEPHASLFLVQRLRDYLDVDACAPENGERVELSL